MHDLSLLDETLDINITRSYHLSIQIDLDGFSFCILDTTRNKYVALKHYPFDEGDLEKNMNTVFEKDEFLKQEFKSSKLIFTSRKSTLVPNPLFNKENLEDYFTFNHQLSSDEQVKFNRIRNAESYVVYAVPDYLAEITANHLPAAKLFHQSVPMIETIFLDRRNKRDQVTVYLNLDRSLFDIVVVENKKLVLHNCFSYREENDLLYFVLYIYEQLKLSPEKTGLQISGLMTKKSAHYSNLRRYIRHIQFGSPNPLFTYSYTFNEIPSHTFLNLLNLYNCE